eukprot:CAMPEP_0197686636 /NCGR_PEP_ID=MMETSP1338-20131121/102781_1 /TAXON_ID=43686 ORGANISM="Pelagodinium beii, Strain RCC1491" /NCGR_SAMPLE_ID=MMETSP1338 /ASSEMBLY_ACC=CAM_ASM_000754 /LENGTH=94 /DNA_ID=CAMNT_0043268597 /DNA_START=6 /DNA_END=287 /DNA_ORIENTATION=-
MVSQGFAMFAFDCSGHGYSPGERVLVESFKDFEDAFLEFFRLVRSVSTSADFQVGCSTQMLQALQQKPFFIGGESMGGALSMLLAKAVDSWPLF